MTKVKDGFWKQLGSKVGSNDYLLKAAGGYIGVGNSSGEVVPLNNGTKNENLNADMIDGLHEISFYRHRGSYGKSYTAASTEYNLGPGTYTTSEKGYSGTLLSFNSSGSASGIQFWTHYNQGNLYYRTSVDSNRWSKTNGVWTRILDSDNYTSYTDSKYLRKDTNDSTSYQYEFTKTNDHAIKVGTIRGRAVGSQTGEYIHLYERVAIGSPSGWGSRNAPTYGLATYGGAWLATDTGNVGIGTTSPSYKLQISGDSYTTGWSRAANGFYVEGTGVHFTHQGSLGEIDITSNNEFLWGASTATLYFNYRAVSRGTTVNNYIWNAGSSTSWASHNMGNIWLNGSGVNLRLGPQNSSHAHYETNAVVSHWFNKRVDVNGDIWRYGTNYGISSDGYFHAKAVYANRDASTTGGGVSLYSNADPMTYGIAFRGTGTYGIHGFVTSANDWATYLTMSDDLTRGWIFRRGSTNVASIAGSGNMAIGQHLKFSNEAHISTNRSTDYHYGYTFNLGDNAKSIGMYSGPAGEAGGVVISPDGCLIYNSSDCGYNLQVRDKDLGGDLTNIATLTFAIEQSGYYVWSRGGFKKNGSDDSYVLLGGGGHKAESGLSVNYANSAGTTNSLGSGALKYMCSLYATSTYNAYKITTDWHKSSNIMPTINIRGYAYGSMRTIDCDIVMYHYNNTACNYSLTNKGSYPIRVWQAIENDVQVFYINPGEYFGMFNVFVYSGIGTNVFTNWSMTTVDAVSGTEIGSTPIATSITGNADTVDGYHASSFSLSTHTHTFNLGNTTITTNGGSYSGITGPFNIYTNANAANAFSILRDSGAEGVQHWIDDGQYHIDYTNDETASSIHIRIINTDTESGNKTNTTDYHYYLDCYGTFHPGSNNTGSIGTAGYKWANMYATTFHGSLDGNASTATSATSATQATNLTPENTAHYFRDPNNSTWRGGMIWGSAGSESMSFVVANSGTRFQFVGGSDIVNWGSSTWQSANPYLTIYSSGIVTPGSATASGGFIKSGYDDNYVLLAGGGHKAISDFSMAHSHPYLPTAGGTMTGAINLSNTNAKLTFGSLGTSPITGYKAPSLGSSGVGIYSRYGGSSDEGAIIITEDTCVIYNSADTGWNFQVMDKDIGTDMTNDATRSFGINQNHQAVSLSGFVKSGYDNTYVLLAGGGHKLESNLSVSYATNAGDAHTVDGEHASAFAHIGAHNNLIASGNEFTFASSGFSGDIWINYRTAGGSNGNITNYILGNGKGGSLGYILTSSNWSSYISTSSPDYTIWRDNSSNVDYKLQVVSSLPSSTNSNTFYVIV